MRKLFLFIVSIALAACGSKSRFPAATDTTNEFLGSSESQTYAVGTSNVTSGPSEVTISKDGTLEIKYNDPKCPFATSGKLNKVTKALGGKHVMFEYTESEAKLDSSVTDDKSCQKFLTDYQSKNLPKKTTKIACGNSADYIDFGCKGDKNSPSNWIKK